MQQSVWLEPLAHRRSAGACTAPSSRLAALDCGVGEAAAPEPVSIRGASPLTTHEAEESARDQHKKEGVGRMRNSAKACVTTSPQTGFKHTTGGTFCLIFNVYNNV